ncbi:hypothetical protein LN042_12460 [Kitasatospora sp. RB6PN24]|uniref:hypothetical protein n=1 Tax=Kitasatospora humi TaxID=2893891 RepID=UPI001E2B5FE1|nr:hypothetical protein [Kitasatospora humi]MCC9307894.1 hypothetical protein [Kitasatospora humi]
MQFGGHGELDGAAAVAGDRGARAHGGQRQLLRQIDQSGPPVGELFEEHALRVALLAEQLALPERVVGVLARQFLPAESRLGQPGGVGGGHVPAGSVTHLTPPGDFHLVRNATSGKVVSLHVYGTDVSARGTSIRRAYDLPIQPPPTADEGPVLPPAPS